MPKDKSSILISKNSKDNDIWKTMKKIKEREESDKVWYKQAKKEAREGEMFIFTIIALTLTLSYFAAITANNKAPVVITYQGKFK